jgi:DNA (cytosine-5)-methyltransferase 3A|nr:MAG TPA: Cytosine specific methyltransferase [Caudoviricetes sp.]
MKILLGGSPCTYWSIAQKNNRETEPSGLGWELFENYLIAKEKFKPDFFLYENNKSAAQAIKDEIKKRFNVWDGTLLTPDSGARYIEINSALVSAQNRQRFYVHNCGEVGQPEDRRILLRDILESGTGWTDKSYAVTTRDSGAIPEDTLKRKRHTMVAEPVACRCRGRVDSQGKGYAKYECRTDGKGNALDTNTVNGSMVAEPVRIGTYPNAIPVYYGAEAVEFDESGKPTKARSYADGKIYAVYEVKNGKITIKGKEYPIKLADGFYIIRKLTVTECSRLQTLPDDYCRAVSNSQAYRGLGNGWTAEVIIHILSGALKDVPRDEEIVVLSMYDGIGTGRYCLDKMGFTNVKYYAYEIDKYAIQIAKSNYPDIIECGDAFQVRNKDWKL